MLSGKAGVYLAVPEMTNSRWGLSSREPHFAMALVIIVDAGCALVRSQAFRLRQVLSTVRATGADEYCPKAYRFQVHDARLAIFTRENSKARLHVCVLAVQLPQVSVAKHVESFRLESHSYKQSKSWCMLVTTDNTMINTRRGRNSLP